MASPAPEHPADWVFVNQERGQPPQFLQDNTPPSVAAEATENAGIQGRFLAYWLESIKTLHDKPPFEDPNYAYPHHYPASNETDATVVGSAQGWRDAPAIEGDGCHARELTAARLREHEHRYLCRFNGDLARWISDTAPRYGHGHGRINAEGSRASRVVHPGSGASRVTDDTPGWSHVAAPSALAEQAVHIAAAGLWTDDFAARPMPLYEDKLEL